MGRVVIIGMPTCDETDNIDDVFCKHCGERLPDPLNMPDCPFCGQPIN